MLLKFLPLSSIVVTSKYGSRNITVNGHTYKWHSGVDLKDTEDHNIYNVADGYVHYIGEDKNGYGKYIIVEHKLKDGISSYYYTLYAHMDSFSNKVERNKPINAGDILGKVGSTGASTGPHLHFEIRICDKSNLWSRGIVYEQFENAINPLPHIELREKIQRLPVSNLTEAGFTELSEVYDPVTINFIKAYKHGDLVALKHYINF